MTVTGSLVHKRGGSIKSNIRGSGVIEGYLIVFGNPEDADLEGQYFTKNTVLRLDYFDSYPMLYHHGMDNSVKLNPIGRINKITVDDVGVWVRAQIDMSDRYGTEVYQMVQTKQFGWSSGSIDHLVKIDPNGEIKIWPLFEGSVTPTPAQPHKTTVRALKAVLDKNDPITIYLRGHTARADRYQNSFTQFRKLGDNNMEQHSIKSSRRFVRAVLSKHGYKADEETINAIAADLADEEATMAGDGFEDDATLMDEDDSYATLMDEDDDAMLMDEDDAMLMDDEDDATLMDDEDDAMLMDDEDDAMLMDDEDDAMLMDDDDAVLSAYLAADEDDDDAKPQKRRRTRSRRTKGRTNGRTNGRTKRRAKGRKSYKSMERRILELEALAAPGEKTRGIKSVKVIRDRADQPGAYKSAFEKYIRFGEIGMGASAKAVLRKGEVDYGKADSIAGIKALNTSNAGSVGFGVPDDFVAELNRNIMVAAVTAQECKVRKTSGDRILVPDLQTTDARRAYRGQAYWPGESPASQDEHDVAEIQLSQIELPVHVLLVSTTSTYSALEDVAFDLQEMINEQFAETVAIQYEELIWRGDGQGKMKGIVNDTRVTGTASASVQTPSGYIASGKASSIQDADKIRSMMWHLPPGYRQRAKWYMNSTTADAIFKLKDADGNYIWGERQGLNDGLPTTLMNKPIVYNEWADDVSAGLFPLLLADLSRGYTIGKRVEFSVRRFDDSTYAVKDQALFMGRARIGGQVTQPIAIKALKVAVS